MTLYGVENVPDAPFQIINGVGQIPDADEVMGNDESIREWLRNVAMEALLPTGTILQYGSDSTPEGFLSCNGGDYNPITEHPGLFAVIGYSFSPDGTTTGNFHVPDIRGRVLFGDSGVLDLGDSDDRSVSERDGTHAHSMDHIHEYGQDPYNQRFTQGGGADPLGTTYGSTQGASATNTGIASPDFLVVNSIIKS